MVKDTTYLQQFERNLIRGEKPHYHKIRVIILLQEEIDIGEKEWLKLASINNAFDFLKEPEEDIYTPSDGKPFHDQGVK